MSIRRGKIFLLSIDDDADDMQLNAARAEIRLEQVDENAWEVYITLVDEPFHNYMKKVYPSNVLRFPVSYDILASDAEAALDIMVEMGGKWIENIGDKDEFVIRNNIEDALEWVRPGYYIA